MFKAFCASGTDTQAHSSNLTATSSLFQCASKKSIEKLIFPEIKGYSMTLHSREQKHSREHKADKECKKCLPVKVRKLTVDEEVYYECRRDSSDQ
ncbi:hypothetical protein QQG55_41495 [Brugia pahangi]